MPSVNQTSNSVLLSNKGAPASPMALRSVRDLLATVCAQLGMDAAHIPAVLAGRAFGRGTGFAYRLLPDPGQSVATVRVEVALPMHSVELLPVHWAQLFEMQAVMVAHMGWSLGLESVSGQLRLAPLAAGTSPERVVADIDIGTVLATSVLQLVTEDAPRAPELSDAGSDS